MLTRSRLFKLPGCMSAIRARQRGPAPKATLSRVEAAAIRKAALAGVQIGDELKRHPRCAVSASQRGLVLRQRPDLSNGSNCLWTLWPSSPKVVRCCASKLYSCWSDIRMLAVPRPASQPAPPAGKTVRGDERSRPCRAHLATHTRSDPTNRSRERIMAIRRVITGTDNAGASKFLADDVLDELSNINLMLSSVWRNDGTDLHIPPKVDVDDAFGFPAPGGAWVLAWTIPPNCVAGEQNSSDAPTAAGELPTGGAHATDSIDVNFILSGQAVFQLEDGTEKVLEQGESIVVNGNSHTWHNRHDQPTQVLSLIFGARRAANRPEAAN